MAKTIPILLEHMVAINTLNPPTMTIASHDENKK